MLNTDRLCLGCMNDSSEAKICPICGYDSSTKNPEGALPAKFWLNDRYLIGKVIATNGETISYIGWDNVDNSIVTVKEYFPVGCAHRNPDKNVSIVKGKEYAFNEGLMSFIDINSTIMKNQISGILPIKAVFEENGTVYAIQPKVMAITLREFLTKNGGTLEWEQVKLLFLPLIEAVNSINNLGVIHRGISPETVLVGREGKLYLTGFSIKSFRTAGNDINSQLYSGYAAIEQYNPNEMSDGKYTDVYGICATLFRTLIGTVPPEATARINNDSMTIPARFAEAIPRNVLSALANGLQVIPQDRIETAELLKAALLVVDTSEIAPIHTKRTEEVISDKQKYEKNKKKNNRRTSGAKYAVISAVCTALIFIVVAAILAGTVFKDMFFGNDNNSDTPKNDYSSAPESEQEETTSIPEDDGVKKYELPSMLGKFYSDIVKDATEDTDSIYNMVEIIVTDREYSDKYPKGTISYQSIAGGEKVPKKTQILVKVSLGPKEIKIANVVGQTSETAKFELVKQGFLYENIIVEEKYEPSKAAAVIIEQKPAAGTTVSVDKCVTIVLNTKKVEETQTGTSSENANTSSESLTTSSSINVTEQ